MRNEGDRPRIAQMIAAGKSGGLVGVDAEGKLNAKSPGREGAKEVIGI
jgi:hypothetical protein